MSPLKRKIAALREAYLGAMTAGSGFHSFPGPEVGASYPTGAGRPLDDVGVDLTPKAKRKFGREKEEKTRPWRKQSRGR